MKVKIQEQEQARNLRAQGLSLNQISRRVGVAKSSVSIGMTPSKSLSLQFPDIPLKYMQSLTREYFDGDGFVYFGMCKRNENSFTRLVFQSGFTSGSRGFLKVLQGHLHREARMGLGSLHPNDSCWELSYSTNNSRQLYKFMYPTDTAPCLKRKRDIFERAMKQLGPVV